MFSAPSPIMRRLLPAANCICLAWVSKHMEMSQMKPSLHYEPKPRRGLCELFRFFKTTTKGWRAPLKSHYCVAFFFFSFYFILRASGCLEERRSRPFEDAQENVSLASCYPRPERKRKRKNTWRRDTCVTDCFQCLQIAARSVCLHTEMIESVPFLIKMCSWDSLASNHLLEWLKKYVGHQQLLRRGGG